MNTSNTPIKPLNCTGKIPWNGGPSFKQHFSYPFLIIYYIARNPANPKVYSKLVKSCKYFFEKLPLLVVSRVHDNGRKFCSNNDTDECEGNENCLKIDSIKKSPPKIWLTHELQLCGNDDTENVVSLLSTKFYCYKNVLVLNWANEMTIIDFGYFASRFEKYFFVSVKMRDKKGRDVMLEKIIESIPNLKRFEYMFNPEIPIVTASTMKNILKLKNLGNLRSFSLYYIPEVINLQDLAFFIKAHNDTKFWLNFIPNITEAYKVQLDELVDAVVASNLPSRYIGYHGQDQGKQNIMLNRYCYDE